MSTMKRVNLREIITYISVNFRNRINDKKLADVNQNTLTSAFYFSILSWCQVMPLVGKLKDKPEVQMKIDEITQASLLYDFYGQLLSKRQKEVMELYHEENLTLSEIASEFDISRQGVHDALKNAEKSLKGYEEKLGLVEKFEKTSDAIRGIDNIIEKLIASLQNAEITETAEIVKKLEEIKSIIDKLED